MRHVAQEHSRADPRGLKPWGANLRKTARTEAYRSPFTALLTGGLLVRIQPEEPSPFRSRTYEVVVRL